MTLLARRTTLVSLLFLGGLLTGVAGADDYSHRQYYGNWQKHPTQGYSYRSYYYKPTQTYSGYKHHYVIQHPGHPDHLYFYNPYQQKFWGRCPAAAEGKPLYSLLAEKDRSGDLSKIPESAFPKPGKLPPIPESADGVALDLPPDDLPASVDGLPK